MKVVFILDSIINPNSIKRIDEFHENGFDVEAYGFKRDINVGNKPQNITVKSIGEFPNASSYFRRSTIIKNGIRSVLKKYKGDKCLYYLIGLDVALFFRIITRKPYIFEEADMTHLNIRNGVIKNTFEMIDKHIIRNSVYSVFRSGGFVNYHFGNIIPDNVLVIPNRLNKTVLDLPIVEKKKTDAEHMRFGYVGLIRYDTIRNFVDVLCTYYPSHEFHFWGAYSSEKTENSFSHLNKYSNCYFHGPFKSPDDLPTIYSQIDVVLATYDTASENVKYAEPNKLYEAIYFDTPIIVSKGTYLSNKVEEWGVGYSVDANDADDIKKLVSELNGYELGLKQSYLHSYNKTMLINNNMEFIAKVKNYSV